MQENSGNPPRQADSRTQKSLRTKPLHEKKLRRFLFLPLFLLLALPNGGGIAAAIGATETPPASVAPSPPLAASCREFDKLNTLIRDGKISKVAGRSEVSLLLNRIKEQYRQEGGETAPRADWHFPLRGYTVAAVGEGPSHGYLPKGYDYYDGNRHGGHPSLDIFIHDNNQDDLDDRSGKQVPVLSVSGGMVVSRETEWVEGSKLKGGKYLWLYDPSTDHLLYYAHLREIAVQVGTRVEPGDVLGYVGRTGLNAHKKRSPTHLHLTSLSTATSALLPENIYQDLLRARTVK
jgi:peptidoglycan LD-endopeptidase LytH